MGDLYLACGCARGDAAALAAFEREHLRWLHGVLRKSGADDDTAVEVLQNLRRDLLAPRRGQTPGIAAFAGRAELRSWLRVAAVRELARVAVRARREVRLDTHEISALPGDDDVETRHLKAIYRDDFKIAFNEAMAQLTGRQRRLLRYQVIEQLSIDEIGALHRVHRATAARWLVEARAVLSERTRALLGVRLRIERGEVQSVLKLVESQIDVSVERLLKQP
jgi:RNA polymerase sigma-70 factor (ECF subfamily)